MSKRRILIADDNSDAAQSLAILLGLEGHDVRVTNDGHATLNAFQDFNPDVAVLDIGMPGMTGYELAAQIRALSGPSIVLIAVTGWGQDKDKERARAAGFDHHFTKPVEPEDLMAVLGTRR
jgi:CheY-like chemotaxis protein